MAVVGALFRFGGECQCRALIGVLFGEILKWRLPGIADLDY